MSSDLLVNFTWIDFGAKPLYSALAILSALATQAVCSRLTGLPSIDLRSPLITGLSLSLLLRADAAWLPAVAGVIAIASKFIFRIDGKHIWNPAGFAIVVLLFTQHGVWISPGQWGTSVWLAALLVFFAILVLQAAQRSDIALFFLGSHGALLVARAVWLGDPLAVPLHQLQSGSLLIFAFFMISDPRTAPDSRLGRLLFAVSVAALGHYKLVLALVVLLFELVFGNFHLSGEIRRGQARHRECAILGRTEQILMGVVELDQLCVSRLPDIAGNGIGQRHDVGDPFFVTVSI